MSIKEWPKSEQPREKLLKLGPQALGDAELLAIFIRTGVPGKNALAVARDILIKAGSLRTLLNLSANDLYKFSGIGPAKYVQFQASLELGRRYLMERLDAGEIINNPQASRDYLSMCLRDKDYEAFFALFLDSKHQVIHHQEL